MEELGGGIVAGSHMGFSDSSGCRLTCKEEVVCR